MTSKLYFVMRRRQRASRPVKLARLSIHLSTSWSVRIIKRWLSMYGLKRKTDQKMARRSCCAVSYRVSKLVSERNQYPIGFFVSSGCFWNKPQSICILHASVLSVLCPPEYASDSTGGDIGAFLSVYMAWMFSWLSATDVFCWVFSIVGAAVMPFAGSWVWIVYWRFISVEKTSLLAIVLGGLSLRIASVVCGTSFKCIWRITWPR